jgi:hypothetical protein
MSLPAEEVMVAYLDNLRLAREAVRRHAATYAPHADAAYLEALLHAVGPAISVDEAIEALNRAEERALLEHEGARHGAD